MSRLLLVAYFLEAGLLLTVAPWSAFWDRNYFVAAWPWLGEICRTGFVRGGVSGIGLVSVVAGLLEFVRLVARGSRDARPDVPAEALSPKP